VQAGPDGARRFTVSPPPGWDRYPELTDHARVLLARGDPLEGERYGVEAWAAPGQGSLHVSWVEGAKPAAGAGPEALVRAGFDRIRAGRTAAAAAPSTAETAYREGVADGVAALHLEWRHLSNETVTLTRALAWADRERRVQLVRADCVFARSAAAEARPV